MLKRLPDRLKQFLPPRPDLDACEISVVVEQVIASGRRIDIVVRIFAPDGDCCLAIENKPYAGDLDNQVKDYLEYLEKQYGERFVLIYMSPTGEGPSEWSVDRKALDKRWQCQFAIMAYHEGQEGQLDEFDSYRVPNSLANWLGECRKICEVERVRWFLYDAEMFCRQTFGDRTMTTDSETSTVRDFLLSNPDHLTVARAVYESWPAIKKDVCGRFLTRLRCRIARKLRDDRNLHHCFGDMHVGCKYSGDRSYSNQVWLYRTCWVEYEEAAYDIRRTAILLEAEGKGPYDWYIGVRVPRSAKKMTNEEKKRRDELTRNLESELGVGGGREDWWAWWDWVDGRWHNWNPLLPDLQRESETEDGGEITKYFVDRFIEVATRAIPAINKIEGNVA